MSIIDDYEQDTLVSYSPSQKLKDQFDQDLDPIFKKHKVEYRLEDVIVQLAVCNNVLMLYQANRKLLRIELIGGQKSEIDLNKLLSTKAESIDAVRLFLSPTGQHCLLSICYDDPSSSPECFYVCKKKLISLKTKGHHVTQVGWNMKAEQSGTSSSSYYCLVGTSRGLLFELELLNTDENKWSLMSSSMDSSLRCMYDLRSEHCMMTINGMIEPEQCSVTGIHFDYIPINTLATTQLYFIVVTTPLQIFHFSGTTDSFGSECRPPAFTNCKVQSFPDNFQSSLFDVFLNFDQRPTGLAWLMDQGVYYSPLEFQSTDNYNDITIRNRIISLKSVLQTESPVSFALTPHHLLLLFKSHLKVVCILNGQTVMEDKFLDAYGAALGVTRDPLKGTVWAYSERAIYRYKITQEDRNLIDIYLQQKDFPNARLCAKGELLKLNRINEQEAQHLFDQEKFMESARLFAKCNRSFEQTVLKFVNLPESSFLKEYLINKLDSLLVQDQTQASLLIIWIIELIMKDMTRAMCNEKPDHDRIDELRIEFESILGNDKIKSSVQDCKLAIYELLKSHSNTDLVCSFALQMSDYDIAIEQHIQLQRYKEALDLLRQHKNDQLLYLFGPLLFREQPAELVQVLIDCFPSVDYSRLLPTLVWSKHCSASKNQTGKNDQNLLKREDGHDFHYTQLVRYLEHCVDRLQTTDQTVFNYLLTIYAELSPEKLIQLCNQDNERQVEQFDLKYALSVCTEKQLHRACVEIYSLMQLYDEAVESALKMFDVELAKQIADRPEVEDEHRRRLWMRVAEHVIQDDRHDFKLDDLLRECPLLRIDDVLQYLPEVSTIDYFKHAVRESLHDFRKELQSLHEDMDEVNECSDHIQQQLRLLRTNHRVLRGEQLCFICERPLFSQPFVAFPCHHLFHLNCLDQHLQQEGPPKLRHEITAVKAQLNAVDQSATIESIESKRRISSQLHDLLSSECPYCDDIMITSIDKPFPTTAEDKTGWD